MASSPLNSGNKVIRRPTEQFVGAVGLQNEDSESRNEAKFYVKFKEEFMVFGLNRQVFTQISYGLYIVTSHLDEKLNGQIVNTVLQVTSEPPRVAVIINKNNLTHEYISQSRVFGASVLDTSTPMTFIGLFGFKSGRNEDKLSKAQFVKGSTGVPLVTEHCLSVLEARVIDEVDLGLIPS